MIILLYFDGESEFQVSFRLCDQDLVLNLQLIQEDILICINTKPSWLQIIHNSNLNQTSQKTQFINLFIVQLSDHTSTKTLALFPKTCRKNKSQQSCVIIQQITTKMIKDDNKILGPLISIKNVPEKGLRICWNFQGLMSEIDYEIYHIFFFVGVHFEQSKKLLKMYYQNMKMGELIGVYRQGYDDQAKYKKQVKWTQKTSFQLQSEFFREKHVWNQLTQNDIKILVSQTTKNRGQVIINIVTTQIILKDFECFSSIIKSIRQKNKESEKLIFNFIGKLTSVTRIDCTLGINAFFYDHQNEKKVIKQIKNYLKVIVLKKLRVRILMNNNYHCKLNGDDSWKISQSSILQKDYYAIPSCSFKQYLIFISSDQEPQMEINLKFILDISYYNDKQVVSKRQINFVTNSNEIKYQTVFNFENIQFGPTQLKKQIYWTNLIKKYCYVIIFKTQIQ